MQSKGIIRPISLVPSTPCLLLYADDLLFFLKAAPQSITRVKKSLLGSYQVAAGHVFNYSKSNLYIGKCNPRKKRAIISQLDISLADPPTFYLGVPLFLGGSRKIHFSKLLEALHARISGWETKSLSFASRLVLVRHVLSSMSIHFACRREKRHLLRLRRWTS